MSQIDPFMLKFGKNLTAFLNHFILVTEQMNLRQDLNAGRISQKEDIEKLIETYSISCSVVSVLEMVPGYENSADYIDLYNTAKKNKKIIEAYFNRNL